MPSTGTWESQSVSFWESQYSSVYVIEKVYQEGSVVAEVCIIEDLCLEQSVSCYHEDGLSATDQKELGTVWVVRRRLERVRNTGWEIPQVACLL